MNVPLGGAYFFPGPGNNARHWLMSFGGGDPRQFSTWLTSKQKNTDQIQDGGLWTLAQRPLQLWFLQFNIASLLKIMLMFDVMAS